MERSFAASGIFSLLRSYFPQTHIAFAEVNQVKGHIPALTIRAGNLKRALFPITREINGVPCDCWVQQYPVELNLMTNGRQVSSDGFSYNENTAVSDLVDLINFLGSPHAKEWCLANDISIRPNSDVMNVTSLINDVAWEFRARVEILVGFTQLAVGAAGIIAESSIKETTDPDTGKKDERVEPEWQPTPSGGGSSDLAEEETGYFEHVIIENYKED